MNLILIGFDKKKNFNLSSFLSTLIDEDKFSFN